MNECTRRGFLAGTGALATGGLVQAQAPTAPAQPRFRLGTVTYNISATWDLPTLLRVCRSGGLAAAEVLARSGSRLAGLRLLDVVYADWPTPLAAAAAAAGAQVVSGLHMLVHQAVEQVELMTGQRPDWRTMLAAGEEELAQRAR